MPLSLTSLESAAARPLRKSLTLNEARTAGAQTAFLCHSHLDRARLIGLLNLISDEGWKVYVDWADEDMPETPTYETAARIQGKIRDLNYFLFLATPNSMSSRWCPWEIGFADGVKRNEQIIVIPTTDHSGRSHGSEYLQLYRHVDLAREGGLGVWKANQTGGVRLHSL